MAKFYQRGEPATEELRKQAQDVRDTAALPENHDALRLEFGEEYQLHDLVNGDLELEAESGDLFRCYIVFTSTEDFRLVIDDYHPEEDAHRQVDAYGQILEPYDDPEVP